MVSHYLLKTDLSGQGTVVLGAGAGMGAESCRALSEAGATLLCVDRDPELAGAIAEECGGIPIAEEVTSREGMQRILAKAGEAFGTSFKGLVDIVGMANPQPLEKFDDASFQAQLDIILRHAFLAIQLGAPMIAANGGGAMTFIGSGSGLRSVPNQTVYGLAKAALHHLVLCSSREFAARGVRMNVIAPNYVRTPRLLKALGEDFWRKVDEAAPMKRAGTTEDIASVVLFLQSSLAAYVTGNVLTLDGGAAIAAALPEPDS
jgi:NAD(P)-dependent dehydrogenase (short-subunit alcohol dehydrogenase family)